MNIFFSICNHSLEIWILVAQVVDVAVEEDAVVLAAVEAAVEAVAIRRRDPWWKIPSSKWWPKKKEKIELAHTKNHFFLCFVCVVCLNSLFVPLLLPDPLTHRKIMGKKKRYVFIKIFWNSPQCLVAPLKKIQTCPLPRLQRGGGWSLPLLPLKKKKRKQFTKTAHIKNQYIFFSLFVFQNNRKKKKPATFLRLYFFFI